MQNQRTRPFLKWAGGKFKLLDRLDPHLKGKRLIEPFVGAGAVFLNLPFEKYIVGDINADLINLFECLKKEKEGFIEYCRDFCCADNNNRERYSELREKFNSGVTGRKRAAIFIYLNRHGFNGLCRYNKSGGFNVPFGQYKKTYFPEKEMRSFIARAKGVKFVCSDFVSLMEKAKQNDVVYCDPPYVPLSTSSMFTDYATGGFNHEQQTKLAMKAKELAAKGIKVVISNHDCEITRELYKGAKIESFAVQRFISRDGDNRVPVKELLAVF